MSEQPDGVKALLAERVKIETQIAQIEEEIKSLLKEMAVPGLKLVEGI